MAAVTFAMPQLYTARLAMLSRQHCKPQLRSQDKRAWQQHADCMRLLFRYVLELQHADCVRLYMAEPPPSV